MKCKDCATRTRALVRGLCSRCYQRHRTDGTLERFDRIAPPGNGVPEIEGVTYRQLDYWVSRGYLCPEGGTGTGVARHWPDDELAVARTMGRLVAAGLTPAVAHRVARGDAEIAPGVKVLVSA